MLLVNCLGVPVRVADLGVVVPPSGLSLTLPVRRVVRSLDIRELLRTGALRVEFSRGEYLDPNTLTSIHLLLPSGSAMRPPTHPPAYVYMKSSSREPPPFVASSSVCRDSDHIPLPSLVSPGSPLSELAVAALLSRRDLPFNIALIRLDGMGGTLTLSDQAKKVYVKTGIKPTLVVRGYRELFRDNPYVGDVVVVGAVKWESCLEEVKGEFGVVGDIRLAVGRWYCNDGITGFEQDSEEWQNIYDRFPRGSVELEKFCLNHVQLTDRVMGLPHDNVDVSFYHIEEPRVKLPSEYIVVNNGTDAAYEGKLQTKSWPWWNRLVPLLELPVVQVGLYYDEPIANAVDLRGKTNLYQAAGVLRDAVAVVCCEGGIMHLAKAVGSKEVVVLRGPTRGYLFQYPGHTMVDSYVCSPCYWDTEKWHFSCPKQIDAVCMKSITPERVAYVVSTRI